MDQVFGRRWSVWMADSLLEKFHMIMALYAKDLK